LSTVALCPENEHRLLKDLDTFTNNKAFYKRVGFPFRRGYLLHGQPGTGKTSLVLAVASYLQLSLYFINLGYIRSDAELIQAFSTVPANAIVVFEDVDTQSTVSV
ncbi:P-loop containing nucleoside triphosphate hydrolase protein, partial [Absidia repens]